MNAAARAGRPDADRLLRWAEEAGLDLAGLAPAGAAPHADFFRAWVADGLHGGLAWLARRPEVRADARVWWPAARALLLGAVSYRVEEPPAVYWDDPERGRIARYAWGPDYHEALGERLRELAQRLAGAGVAAHLFVDTAPVLERDWAVAAGLGFIGKNAQLIRPGWGSYLLLGGLALDYAPEGLVPPSAAEWTRCGRCAACLDACPVGALVAPGRLDARRCLSYWTIEHRGPVPPGIAAAFGRRLFGCDECQQVCPWTLRAARGAARPFHAFDPDRCAPRLADVGTMDEAAFRRRWGGTPVARAGLVGLRRNAEILRKTENGNWKTFGV